MYSDFTIYVPRVHIPDARWLDGRVKWTRPKRGGPYRKPAGQGHQEGEGGGRGRGRAGQLVGGGGGRGGPRWGCGVAPGENGTFWRGMVRGGRVEWGKAPTLKFNATYLGILLITIVLGYFGPN